MSNASHNHPGKEQLLAFSLGKLLEQEAEQVADHLDSCHDCSATIVSLEEDTFVELVRKLPASAFADAPNGYESEATIDVASGSTSGTSILPPELREHAKFDILGLLGHGGMGDVYKAHHRMMDRLVALKVIKPELVRNDAAVDRFQREVQAAAKLQHANIVTAHDAERAGDLHYLVMEYVDGENLDELVSKQGPLPVNVACDYVRQVAEGLQHAHDLGMVHRDIKPHNLMVAERTGTIIGSTTVVKILDFGLANFAQGVAADKVLTAQESRTDTTSANSHQASHRLTQMGTMMGTADYIAPEQAVDAHAADIRADVYSLGCTLFTLLTGKPPFHDLPVLEKIKAHSERELPVLSELRSDIPVEVEVILKKMVAKNADDRFQQPAAVAQALSPYTQAQLPKPTPKRVRGRGILGVFAAGLVLLATVFAAAVYYIQTNHGTVRIDVTDEALRVDIDGKTVRMDDGEQKLTIGVGDRKLSVRMDNSNFAFETDKFQIRRGGKVAFKIQRLNGQAVVTKDGEEFAAQTLPAATQKPSSKSDEAGDFEITAQLAQMLEKSGRTKAEFKKTLFTILSQSASVPNAEWESFATHPSASTAGIKGEPFSLLLWRLHPTRSAQTKPAVLDDFRYLGRGVPKPNQIAQAMTPSQPHGYVSMIQPEYIKKTQVELDIQARALRGSIAFEAPNLFAGKVNFVIKFVAGRAWQMQVTQFELPNYKIVLGRGKDGSWKRQPNENSGARQNPGSGEAARGLVKTKPTTGRFVATPQGYMVPYQRTIPGTKISFEMLPVPGGTFRMLNQDDAQKPNWPLPLR